MWWMWILNNWKLIVGGVCILGIVGYLGYKELVIKSKDLQISTLQKDMAEMKTVVENQQKSINRMDAELKIAAIQDKYLNEQIAAIAAIRKETQAALDKIHERDKAIQTIIEQITAETDPEVKDQLQTDFLRELYKPK